MRHIILAAAVLAIPFAAQAEVVGGSETVCQRYKRSVRCETSTWRKPAPAVKPVVVEPPRPVLPPSREVSPSGVVVMRGMPIR